MLQLSLSLNKISLQSKRVTEKPVLAKTQGTKATLLKQYREQQTIRNLKSVVKDKYSDKAGMKKTKIASHRSKKEEKR